GSAGASDLVVGGRAYGRHMDLQRLPDAAGVDASAEAGPAGGTLRGLRAARQTVCAAQAEELRWVARLAGECRAEANGRVRELGPVGGDALNAEELGESLAVAAVSCALGIGDSAAAGLVHLAERVTTVLPEVLAAWQTGVLDQGRVGVVATATEVLDDES